MLSGHLGFTPASAVRTPALVQHPVGHLQRDRWQLGLMRVVRRGQGKRRVATRTPRGPQLPDRRGRQEHLAMPLMAWFPPVLRGVVDVVCRRGFLRANLMTAAGRRLGFCVSRASRVPHTVLQLLHLVT